MVFKTNDLLRGLDARLKTSEASRSFFTMSKCCLRAVYNDERLRCKSRWEQWKLNYRYIINRFRISLYQFASTKFGSFCISVLSKLRIFSTYSVQNTESWIFLWFTLFMQAVFKCLKTVERLSKSLLQWLFIITPYPGP